MNKSAIYHRPLSEFAFANSLNEIVIRLKAGVNEIKKVILFYGDTAFQGDEIIFKQVEMQKVATNFISDYFEAKIINGYERIVYYFEIYSHQNARIYYYGDVLTKRLSKQRNDYFKFPFNRIEEIINVPTWFKHAIVYNVFLDSFNFSNKNKNKEILIDDNIIKNKHGGTIKELSKKLNYIKKMGFNTIYLNPIFLAGEYHKYDTIDYFRIDPLFGTNEEFKQLVEDIHNKGMYIILDGVFNHSGWNIKYFKDCLENQEKSIYKDWFYRLDFPIYRPKIDEKPRYSTFGYERLMPKLNTSNPEVIDYFVKVTKYWLEKYKIDGWRLDVADEIDRNFWREIKKATREVNQEAVLIGEIWQTSNYYLDGTMFDTVMNYSFLRYVKEFFADKIIDASEFNYRIINMLYRYCDNTTYAQLNFLDSHDVPRFLSLVNENLDVYKMAVVFLMTFIGVPSVFYGDEMGALGIKEEEYRTSINSININENLQNFYQEIIKLRNSYECLVSGKFITISALKNSHSYHYQRVYDKITIGIILNNNDYSINLENMEIEILLSNKLNGLVLEGYGFVIYKK